VPLIGVEDSCTLIYTKNIKKHRIIFLIANILQYVVIEIVRLINKFKLIKNNKFMVIL
jgi:hypothetical protein